MEIDRLKDMFIRQSQFQHLLMNLPFATEDEKQKFINNQTLALIVELGEALQETRWKPWKKSSVYNEESFKMEIVDCWHFLINLTLTVMNDHELYMLFLKKNEINFERQKQKY